MSTPTATSSASASAAPFATPPTRRLQRPSWRDPRLVVGVLLVLLSVVAGSRVVAAADRTVPVYAARTVLPTGTPLGPDVLQVVRLRLTGSGAAYLDATRPVPAGQVLVRPVGAGEPVPVAAAAPADGLGVRPVTIPLDGVPPAGLAAGGLADVWSSARSADTAGGGYRTPDRIARQVEVFHVERPGTGLSGGQDSAVEVLLGPDTLPLVLDALANDARVAVLPVPGSAPSAAGRGGS